MSTVFQPPPTWAPPVLEDDKLGRLVFNPVWLNWFVLVAARLPLQPPLSTVVVTAPLTGGGTSGSMTFENGTLVAVTPAT